MYVEESDTSRICASAVRNGRNVRVAVCGPRSVCSDNTPTLARVWVNRSPLFAVNSSHRTRQHSHLFKHQAPGAELEETYARVYT
ncbi:Protein of unknown function [Gryllus bimaculatus]|nr:Protein of unknown function [Gryllus bimaculatus]